jgi:hypothetical protein
VTLSTGVRNVKDKASTDSNSKIKTTTETDLDKDNKSLSPIKIM